MLLTIFDLDDTLYPERSYVESGFAAVAQHLQHRFGWDAVASSRRLVELLDQQGRGALFNRLLSEHGETRRREIDACIDAYRHHQPTLSLHPEADRLLDRLPRKPYIVTDGHKLVQARKIEGLALTPRLERAYITHRYGVASAKPSPRCFELIRAREGCDWAQMLYVGDNPRKDFVNLKPLGVRTVRVRQGEYAASQPDAAHEAEFVIDSLAELPDVLPVLT